MVPRPARGRDVTATGRVTTEKAVAEDAGALVAHERVLAPPAVSIGGCIQSVQVEQAAEPVRRRPQPCRPIAIHRTAEVGESPEDLLEATGGDPIGMSVETRGLVRPMP